MRKKVARVRHFDLKTQPRFSGSSLQAEASPGNHVMQLPSTHAPVAALILVLVQLAALIVILVQLAALLH